MRIALAQITTGRSVQDNLGLARDVVARAAEGGAALVVLPEATMRAFGNSLSDIAESLDGPWATALRETADRAGIAVVAGMFTPGEGGRVRNTLLVHGPGVSAHYDKIHLYDAFGFKESATVTPGNRPQIFELGGIRFGLATCYDLRFPALFTANALAGAEAQLLCASWGAGPGKVEQWELLVRARALDSTSYVLACGQGDPLASGIEARTGAPTGVGHSVVVGPFGEVIAQAGAGPEILYAELDTALVASAREALPVLRNRVEL